MHWYFLIISNISFCSRSVNEYALFCCSYSLVSIEQTLEKTEYIMHAIVKKYEMR